MPNLSRFRISFRIDLLLVCLVIGLFALVGVYFAQQSAMLEANKQSTSLQSDSYSLDAIQGDLQKFNRLLVDQFSEVQQGDFDRWLSLRVSLKQLLAEAKEKTSSTELLAALGRATELLQQFDSENMELTKQKALLGENAKDGLLLDLAIVADQLESTLIELNRDDIQAAVLNMRATEKQLVDSPNTDVFSKIDDEIYGVISLLSNLRLAPEESSSVMLLIEKYSKKLQQLLSTSESIKQTQADLMSLVQRLSADVSAAQVNAQEYAQRFTSDTERKLVNMRNLFVLLICLVFTVLFFLTFNVRKVVVTRLKRMSEELESINRGDTRQRFFESGTDEIGQLTQGLNCFLNDSFDFIRKYKAEADRQQGEAKMLCESLQKSLKTKTIPGKLAMTSSGLRNVARSLNELNSELDNVFSQARSCSFELVAKGGELQSQVKAIGLLGEDEQKQAFSMTKALHLATEAMRELARRTESVESLVKGLSEWSAESKSLAVLSSSSLVGVRESIARVESRAQALVEFSQNVQAVESSVGDLSDRTHIVALNSSMFAGDDSASKEMLIEDIQKLSKHAQEVCADVSKVFSTVQTDVLDFGKALNQLLESVGSGIESAQSVNAAMQKGASAFIPLKEVVSNVNQGSAKQADLMEKLCKRSKVLRKYLEKSRNELQTHTTGLRSSIGIAETLDIQLKKFTLSESEKILNSSSFIGGVAQMEVEHIDQAHSADPSDEEVCLDEETVA